MHHVNPSIINLKPPPGVTHGSSVKHMFVCHESVSYNVVGVADILSLESVLKGEGYWIHGATDAEGHKAWAKGHGEDTFWHAGGVNSIAVGCENISEIPLLIQNKKITPAQGLTMWLHRDKQLSALAILIACWHNADPDNHPIVRSDGNTKPGVCSHWDVSQHHKESEGHWDCKPNDKGGHFPLAHVIDLAKTMAKTYEF